MTRRPTVGGPVPVGDIQCSYQALGEERCPQRANRHFAKITGEGMHYTLSACAEHNAIAESLTNDWHDFGPVCEIPGTIWTVGHPGAGDGSCTWNALTDAAAGELVKAAS